MLNDLTILGASDRGDVAMELVKADREILDYMKEHRMATPQEVAIALKKYSIKYIRTRMAKLEKAGLLKRVLRGIYEYSGGGK